MDRPIWSSGLTLIRRFTVVSLVTTIAIGVLVGVVATRIVEDYALRRQAHTAAVYVSEFVAPRLVTEDFLLPPPQKRVQFAFTFRDLIGRAGIIRVTVWNKSGLMLYSDDPKLIGQTFAFSDLARRALDGQVQWQLVRSGQETDADHNRVEVFVPVVVAGDDHPVAVYDVLSDLADLEPVLLKLKQAVWASVVLGILVLYAALFTIVHKASRDLELQQATLRRAFVGTIQSLANAMDARDTATGNHSSRVGEYAEAIARAMGLSKREARDAQVAGFLHDIGKIGIRDGILTKQGPLTREEWALMRNHPLVGYEILQPVPISERIKLAIRHSHEWWDGRGYPEGLAGEQIPVLARVVAVADAFEALTTDRPYRAARPPQKAVEEILRCTGTQFDPQVVEAFLRVWHQWTDGTGTHVPPVLMGVPAVKH